MTKADELWEKHGDDIREGEKTVPYTAFLAALAEYGEAVRAEARKVCDELLSFDYDDPGQSYAKAIKEMKLP